MSDLSRLSTEQPIDLDELRHPLSKMSDSELLRFGRSERGSCARLEQTSASRRARCLSFNCGRRGRNGGADTER